LACTTTLQAVALTIRQWSRGQADSCGDEEYPRVVRHITLLAPPLTTFGVLQLVVIRHSAAQKLHAVRSLAPCASTGSRCWPREVEHERRDVVRHGVVARRRTVPALPIADLRHAGFHRVDEVREVPAEVVGRELLALDHRQEPFDGTAFLAWPSPGAQITFSTVFIACSAAAFESRRFPSLRWR